MTYHRAPNPYAAPAPPAGSRFTECAACDGRGYSRLPWPDGGREVCPPCNGSGWAFRPPTFGDRVRFAIAALCYRVGARLAWLRRRRRR